MKTLLNSLLGLLLGLFGVAALAQNDCPDPEDWPATVDVNAIVHYVTTDQSLPPPLGAFEWFEDELQILSGGDQGTQDITIGGHDAKKVTGEYLNVADSFFEDWAEEEVIDILVQVYGDAAVLDGQGQPRNFNFLTGTLPELNGPVGGQIPVEAKNQQWNWVLFRIENGIRPSDGTRYVGSIPANAQGGVAFGGVNGGTIRFQNVPGLIVRVVAFGQQGAFGEPEDINIFCASAACDPEPETNLAGIDLANEAGADHIVVIDNGDQRVTRATVGPANDKRPAVAPTGLYLNFGITEEYLGKPCNDPRTVKVCVEFYDDPAFEGLDVRFGPEAYATDAEGGVAFVPEQSRHTLQGTGAWIRRAWNVGPVSLFGVNAGANTAGPRFVSENGQVFVSNYHIAVMRTGDHPLAGQDPLADCLLDPDWCDYGNFVELDLQEDIRDGLDVGSSGGDQEMIVEEAGPADDRRLAVRPARDDGTPGFEHQYLNFAILEEALGPNSAQLTPIAICVTYYDDPALIGAEFRPEVYRTDRNGVETFGFTGPTYNVQIEGTDAWRTAYWEIQDVRFSGVNQGPQAAARFWLNDKIFFTRVRYAALRTCGPNAGINLLEECKPPPSDIPLSISLDGSEIVLSWPEAGADYTLQETTSLTLLDWSPSTTTPELIEGNYVVRIAVAGGTRFYRLTQ